jgi:phosphatidate cytidylyltransferase
MVARLVLAAILLPGFITLFFLKSPLPYLVFSTLIVTTAFFEYSGMLQARGHKTSKALGYAWVLAYLLSLYPPGTFPERVQAALFLLTEPGFIFPMMFMSFVLLHILRPNPTAGLANFWADFTAPVYTAFMGGFFIKLQLLPHGAWWTFLLFFYAWGYDAGALFAGKAFGRTSLSPLSPNKTWEGLAGGIVFVLVLSKLLMSNLLARFDPDFPLKTLQLLALAPFTSFLAQAGDLFESMIKRYAGVKDSGILFSRLGGTLDKMDSPVFVAPFLYWIATHF